MIAFLDTNVLVYYVDSRDPKKQRQAETIVDSALDGRMMCLLSEDLNDGQMYGSVRAVNPFK